MVRISISEACQRLTSGQVVAIPTETVYGLAASLQSPDAIERIFALKKRPANNPLIIHLATAQDLLEFVPTLPFGVKELAAHFWPGSLTLVLPVDVARVPSIVRAGLSSAAFRVPSHPVALDILDQVGPLVAPSANLSGSPSSTTPAHIEEDFGDAIPVVDGGACDAGVESTILVFHEGQWQIARLGALSAEVFSELLGYMPPLLTNENKPLCPGRMHRHYSPKARLLLGTGPYRGQAPIVVGYSDRRYEGARRVYTFGSSKSPEEVSHHLYEVLRHLDRRGVLVAWVDMEVPEAGLWKTIRERLFRAAER
ncbi:MAG: L-threonylcarbamoyladenylate synthase [Chlamydiales bacterium]|nr:L-threonylcarbamoyladenylate synthase [Chlamydiales bacterium]